MNAELRQIGIASDGVTPLYAYREAPVVQAAPAPVARPPYGMYVALGIGAAVAVSALALAAAVLAIAVAIGSVSLTICVIVLRSMWQEYATGKGK